MCDIHDFNISHATGCQGQEILPVFSQALLFVMLKTDRLSSSLVFCVSQYIFILSRQETIHNINTTLLR
jgi:hypothetical protein